MVWGALAERRAEIKELVHGILDDVAARDTSAWTSTATPAWSRGAGKGGGHTFSKVSSLVPLHSNCTGELTFQNMRQAYILKKYPLECLCIVAVLGH